MPVNLRKAHDPNKHPRYPKGTTINGVNVGGKFMPKDGKQSAIGRNKPVRAIAAKLAQKGKIKAQDANRRLMNAVARELKAHRANGGDDDQKALRRVAQKAIAKEVKRITEGKPELGRDRKNKKGGVPQKPTAGSPTKQPTNKSKKTKPDSKSEEPQVSIPKKLKLAQDFNDEQLVALTQTFSRNIFDSDSEKSRQGNPEKVRQAHAARQMGLGSFLGGSSDYEPSHDLSTGKPTREGLVEDVKNTLMWIGHKRDSDAAMDRVSKDLVRASLNKMTPAEHYQILDYFPSGKSNSEEANEIIGELRQSYGIGKGEQRQQMRSLRDLIKNSGGGKPSKPKKQKAKG